MRALALLPLFLLLSFAGPVWALSCIEPRMDQAVFDQADAVFVGEVEAERTLSETEWTHLHAFGVSAPERDAMRLYRFAIQRSWKGPSDLAHVVADITWGAPFAFGKVYLVEAENAKDGLFITGLCSNSRPLAHANDQIEWLEKNRPTTIP